MSDLKWDWGNQFADDEDEDESNNFQKWQFGGRDGLIFLIDCSEMMFEENGAGTSFELCIKCAKTIVQNKIISSERDLFGIVFFATEKSSNQTDFKHIYVFNELSQPGAQIVLDLEKLIEESKDFKDLYGHSTDYSLSDALWMCSNMFANSNHKLGFKRVLLFTNNDRPHANDAMLKRQAAVKCEDLSQNSISLELMHMNRLNHRFNLNAFYKDILCTDEDETSIPPDPSERFEELLTRVRLKDHKKRAQSRINFSLGGDVDFSVGVYNLVRTCYKPTPIRLYKKTNEEVRSVTKTFLKETGEILMPQDMKKSQTYASKKINFEKDEVDQIKTFSSPGLKLMGFKPMEKLKSYHHVKPAQFIYPDESIIEGSTTVFGALLSRCLARQKIAICCYIPRKHSPPRFVALVPQAEKFDENNVQVVPPGFHLIFLPFADDFRKLKQENNIRANVDQINKAKEIIKKLNFKFSSESFENPALQKHYVNVEAMALDRDKPDEIEDYLMPNDERINKKAGPVIEEFKNLVFPPDYVPGTKRKTKADTASASKKSKVDTPIDIDIEVEAKNGRLNKLTVAVLKESIKKFNITGAGSKKSDLIEAIEDHFGI